MTSTAVVTAGTTNIDLKALPFLGADGIDLPKLAQEVAQNLVAAAADPEASIDLNELGSEGLGDQGHRSANLRQSIKSLGSGVDDGGPVANGLANLKVKVEELDPSKFDFQPGWKSRMVSMVPFIGTPMARYFAQFESAQDTIDAIASSLNKSKEQLRRDNITTADDRDAYRKSSKVIERRIAFADALGEALDQAAARADEPTRKFIDERLIFKLKQRRIALGKQLAVEQQGALALNVVIENNKELIDGVDNAVGVTVRALEIAVTVALALNNQRIVLDKVKALNETTNNLLTGTARRLKVQGAEIQKMASSAGLDMKALEDSFKDIFSAIQDVSTFRAKAIPEMANQILALNNLSAEAERVIEEQKKGQKAIPAISNAG